MPAYSAVSSILILLIFYIYCDMLDNKWYTDQHKCKTIKGPKGERDYFVLRRNGEYNNPLMAQYYLKQISHLPHPITLYVYVAA